MKNIRANVPRLKLDSESYHQLHRQVLERDKWPCQACDTTQQLQVHHQSFRSQSGSDVEQSMTLRRMPRAGTSKC